MSSGACGINCDLCRLNHRGICTTCGAGTSAEALRKLSAQQRILGNPCPILACAQLNHIGFCMRDCRDFPCENFSSGPYPFSAGFLHMQQRRIEETPRFYAPDGSHLSVDPAYWQAVAQRDLLALCNFTFFESPQPGCLQFRFLNQTLQIDVKRHTLLHCEANQWLPCNDPLLELVTVLYLKNVQAVYPMGQDIVGIKDLKEGHFFTGPHELRIDPLLKRFGEDLDGFRRACATLNGHPMEMADAAFRLLPFPRLPLYFLLWKGDNEFKPRLQVLMDSSIEAILAADAIWALINRVALAFGEV